MEENNKNITLEEAIETYGKTRGLAAYLSSQSFEELCERNGSCESLEVLIFDVLTEFIDE